MRYGRRCGGLQAEAPTRDTTAAAAPLPDGPEGQMALQMMRQMFKGMHVAVEVEVEGEIIETNAGFREGSRVTLMDIQFDQILADPERFKRLASARNPGQLTSESLARRQDFPIQLARRDRPQRALLWFN